MRLAGVLGSVALAVAGASLARPAMVFRHTPVPRTGGAAIGTDSFAFLSARHGFAATTGGAGWVPHVGYQPPTDLGRIERTDDGGATWRTVWARRHVVFGAIAFAGSQVGVAAGSVVTGTAPQQPDEKPFLVGTTDGGRSWRVLPRPPFPGTFLEAGLYETRPAGVLQLASPHAWYVFAGGLWRSTDLGAHWGRVPTPPRTTAVAFPSSLVGFAAAWPRGCRTAQQLWKTSDGGSTWRPLPGTCGPVYTSLDFESVRRGFTSESTGIEGILTGRVIVRATADGGRRWQTRYRAGRWWQTITRLFFSDDLHGWATSDEWDQGFEHSSVHVTRDGGRTWRAVTFPELPVRFRGSSAWAGSWRTSDWGRTWRLSAPSVQIWPDSLLYAGTRRIVARAGVGTIESTDGGRTWHTRAKPTQLALARSTGARAFVATPNSALGIPTAYLRVASGWRPLSPVRFFSASAVAFRSARDGLVAEGNPDEEDVRLPIYRTEDAGRTWAKVVVPRAVPADSQALLAPGTIAIPVGPALFLSVDSGRTWRRKALPEDEPYCSLSRPTSASIWLLCAQFGSAHLVLLRSSDGGARWTRTAGMAPVDTTKLVATGPRSAWTIGAGAWPGHGPPLWHTTDGGSTWREVWPTLAPTSRWYALR